MVSEGPVISTAINGGGPNALCANAPQMAPAGPENIRMVSLAVNYGTFRYASLADLDWSREMELVCPVNKLGHVNLYTINRHGGLDDSGAPALLGAVKPQVVVFNNGPRKGLGQKDERAAPINAASATPYEKNSYLRVVKTPGNEGVWQLHRSLLDPDPAHNTTPDMIANMEQEGDQGFGLSAVVAPDGKFMINNDRNGFSKSYVAH
jgi:hypothetical protein